MGRSVILLDSVILIDHLNGVKAAATYLVSLTGVAHVSLITRAEVLTGARLDRERNDAVDLLALFQTLPLEAGDADYAAHLRQLYRWKLPDALQAALAIGHGLRLATRNTKDFDPDTHSFVDVPYVL